MNQQPPGKAMGEYAAWLDGLVAGTETSLVFVGYPAAFDFSFVHWYMVHFVGRDPFGFYALDLKTYAMAALDTKFVETVKSNMPQEWLNSAHSHIALADAIEQAELFFCYPKGNKGRLTCRLDCPPIHHVVLDHGAVVTVRWDQIDLWLLAGAALRTIVES